MAKSVRHLHPEMERLAGRLSNAQIAARLGIERTTVNRHLRMVGLVPGGPTHPAARRYAGRFVPPKPASIDIATWDLFLFAVEHTYQETGDLFGMRKQRVAWIVTKVLAALDE